jgi:transcriptional regulator NrdR family protein
MVKPNEHANIYTIGEDDMKCPCCETEAKTLVLETRKMNGDIARKRECTSCGKTFTTREFLDPEIVIHMLKLKPKRDGEKRQRKSNNDLFKVWGRV